MQFLSVLALFVAAAAAAPADSNGTSTEGFCKSGTYGCQNPIVNTPTSVATIRVCDHGTWVVAAQCPKGERCEMDRAGGVTCRARTN